MKLIKMKLKLMDLDSRNQSRSTLQSAEKAAFLFSASANHFATNSVMSL